MIFLGTTFFSGRYSLHPSPTPITQITAIQIFDGEYNQLYLSGDSSLTVNNYDDEWTYDTRLNATFNNTLRAGNTEFGLEMTDQIVVKRREVGETKWIVIFETRITALEDFKIRIIDKYARADTEYEYCVSSYLGGIENSYMIQNVYSDFDGYYITDKDCLYGTIYDVDGCDTSRNMTNQTLELLNSKYMHVVSNSQLCCDSGSVTGSFIKLDGCENFNRQASLQNRKDVMNRLSNRKPLILKIHDGRIWMIRVVGTPTDKMKEHYDLRQITFEWVEIGDVNDMETLYNNGFTDIDRKWW